MCSIFLISYLLIFVPYLWFLSLVLVFVSYLWFLSLVLNLTSFSSSVAFCFIITFFGFFFYRRLAVPVEFLYIAVLLWW